MFPESVRIEPVRIFSELRWVSLVVLSRFLVMLIQRWFIAPIMVSEPIRLQPIRVFSELRWVIFVVFSLWLLLLIQRWFITPIMISESVRLQPIWVFSELWWVVLMVLSWDPMMLMQVFDVLIVIWWIGNIIWFACNIMLTIRPCMIPMNIWLNLWVTSFSWVGHFRISLMESSLSSSETFWRIFLIIFFITVSKMISGPCIRVIMHISIAFEPWSFTFVFFSLCHLHLPCFHHLVKNAEWSSVSFLMLAWYYPISIDFPCWLHCQVYRPWQLKGLLFLHCLLGGSQWFAHVVESFASYLYQLLQCWGTFTCYELIFLTDLQQACWSLINHLSMMVTPNQTSHTWGALYSRVVHSCDSLLAYPSFSTSLCPNRKPMKEIHLKL